MCRQLRKRPAASGTQEDEVADKVPHCTWALWLVAIVSFLCYLNSLTCDLVFDDQPAIRDNMDLRPSTPIFNLLHNDFWGTSMLREESHKSYRPLCVLTFRMNYLIHELNPLGYHLVNAVLHTVACLLYHRFCSEFLPQSASFVASLLFAVHPIHTEAVTGVVGRAELLSSIFFLLSLRTYMQSTHLRRTNDYKALFQCLLLAGLAMLSKEQGITVVAVCATYDIFLVQKGAPPPAERSPRGKVKGPTPTWRKDLVLRLLVLGLGTSLLLVLRMKMMGTRLPVFNRFDNPASSESWPIRHLTHHYLVVLNAWLLLFPSDLCCDWTMGTVPLVSSFTDSRNSATLFFYSLVCVVLWKSYRSNNFLYKRVILGVSLCVFPFIPASNLLYPVGFVIAERVLYLPSMGFCFLIAHGWHGLCQANRKYKRFLQLCIVILLCLNIAKTVNRNFDWQTEESLFKSGLEITKTNAKLYNNLGHVMEAEGKHDDALALFLQAAEVQPDDLGSHLNVGRMYNILGMTEKAEQAFWMAKNLLPKVRSGQSYQTHIVPRHMDLFLNLGNLLSRNKSRLEEAQELYREAIIMKTDYIDAYLQRASVLLKLNRSDEAHDMYKEALKHDDMNPDIFYNMGVLLLEQGKSLQALDRFDQALQVDPEHEKSLLNYAILTQDSGDSSLRRLAHERLQVLLEKGRQPERTYFNMGMLAMQDKDASSAENYFRKALQLKTDFESALFNLALVLHETGRPLEAVPYLGRLGDGHLKGLMLLGNIYFSHLRNYTAAQSCYEKLLKTDPTHIPALHNLCAAHFQLGHLDSAEACLLRLHKLAPGQGFLDQQLGLVQQRREKLYAGTKSVPGQTNCSEADKDCSRRLLQKQGMNSRDKRTKLSFFLDRKVDSKEEATL